MTKSTLMAGKRGLIMGVANNISLGWGIARTLSEHGAELAFTYQGEALKKRVEPLASSVGSSLVIPCDVSEENGTENAFKILQKSWDSLDFVVHAIGFSDKNELKGKYVNVSRKNFLNSMDISCYSFTEAARHAAPMMKEGGSLLTLTYYGAEKVMPHYNVMGLVKAALEASVRYLAVDLGGDNIRVNAISAGPLKTLASSGIGDFRYIMKWNQYNSPLKRNTSLEDVGGAALYLLSDLGSGTTGEVLHVDSGYHAIGMKSIDAPDITLVVEGHD
ncbi:MAG: enoyl-ACP reductase FabI [Alphaproteobacteria bacterium]|nr:enoyl-ACP reductase FabI [Alphaproteobacteria bacterium]